MGEILEAHTAWLDSLPVKLLVAAFNYRSPKTGSSSSSCRPCRGRIDSTSTCWNTGRIGELRTLCFHGGAPPETAIDVAEGETTVGFGGTSAFAATVAGKGAVLLYEPALKLSLSSIMPSGARAVYPTAITSGSGELSSTGTASIGQSIICCMCAPGSATWTTTGLASNDSWLMPASCVTSCHSTILRLPAGCRGCRRCADQAIKRDPLCLLDADSRAWVGPELSRLGRPFELADFESAHQQEK